MLPHRAIILGILIFTVNFSMAQVRHGSITVKNGGAFTIGKNVQLVTNSDISNMGALVNRGTIILNGNGSQLFPGIGNNISSMNVLEIRNTGTGVQLNHSIKISGTLKISAGNLALANNDVTIQSTALQTASVSSFGVTGTVSYGTGRFVIERYIPIGAGGHNKSWQLLAVPANGQTIHDTWQEAGLPTMGYGTIITHPLGTAAGYDIYSGTPSIKTFSTSLNTFDGGPSSTSNLINNQKGFMLFVRGDRTVLSGSGTTATVLRTRGTLYTAAAPAPVTLVGAGKNESVGNPYASEIDFTSLILSGGIDNMFYAWDPTLAGYYGVGGYQTITSTNGWIPVPGSGTYTGAHKNIESGQAVIVHATASSGSLTFTEAAKTGGSMMVNKMETTGNFNTRQYIRTSLLTAAGVLADGNAVAFDTDLNNTVDADDALKIINSGENLGLSRENKVLSIEGRNLLSVTDTLFYYTSNLKQDVYQLVIAPENMDLSKQAFLIDNFLHTQMPVSMADSSEVTFNVTSDPLSSKSDRLLLVFKPQTILASSYTLLKAVRVADRSIDLSWKTITGNETSEYVIEKSLNSLDFEPIDRVSAHPARNETTYLFKDIAGLEVANYYRLRMVTQSGSYTYSEVVKVAAMKSASEISVYPNPLPTRHLNIVIGNRAQGKYILTLTNLTGQKVFSRSVLKSAAINLVSTDLPATFTAGTYQLLLVDEAGQRSAFTVVVL